MKRVRKIPDIDLVKVGGRVFEVTREKDGKMRLCSEGHRWVLRENAEGAFEMFSHEYPAFDPGGVIDEHVLAAAQHFRAHNECAPRGTGFRYAIRRGGEKEHFVVDGRLWSVHVSDDRMRVRLLEPLGGFAYQRFTAYFPAEDCVDDEWLPALGSWPAVSTPWERRCAQEVAKRYCVQAGGPPLKQPKGDA